MALTTVGTSVLVAALQCGAVHGALVAATAREAGAHPVSRDRHAARTYDIVGVDYELIS